MKNRYLIELLGLMNPIELAGFLERVEREDSPEGGAALVKLVQKWGLEGVAASQRSELVAELGGLEDEEWYALKRHWVLEAERFLANREVERDAMQSRLLLLQGIKDLPSRKYYERKLRDGEKSLESRERSDEEILWLRYRFKKEKARYHNTVGEDLGRKLDLSLQEQVDALDEAYLATRLKLMAEMKNRENVLGQQYGFREVEGLESLLQARSDLAQKDSIQVYRLANRMLETDVEEDFHRYLACLQGVYLQFPPEDALHLYNFAQNFCIRRVNQGKQDFLRILFDIFLDLLKSGLLVQEGHLSQWDYKNIVSLSLRLGEYAWCLKFLEEYRPQLRAEVQENAWKYNYSTYLYAVGEYGKALKLLQRVEFSDVFYSLGNRSTILKIFYETQEWELLYAHISNFRTWLRRSRKISDFQIKVYRNLLSFTKKLAKLEENWEYRDQVKLKADLKYLKAALEQSRDTANVNWLQERVADLIKKR